MTKRCPVSQPEGDTLGSGLGFVVVTHGGFGEELLRVAQYIMGNKLDRVRAVRVPFQAELREKADPGEPPTFADRQQFVRTAIAEVAAELDVGGGVVILTDIMGGTAFNCARQILDTRRMAIIAGVNLPMLLKIPSVLKLSCREAAAELARRSREAIVVYPGG